YKEIDIGGLSVWIFGLVVWESRELAGNSFGYLPRLLPTSDFFSNLESRPPFSRFVNIRGFVKAEDGRRGGWWLPLWNDESSEDPLESPINNASNVDGQNQSDAIQVAHSSSPDPHSTQVFVVPSNNTTRSNSPTQETVSLTAVSTTADPDTKEKDVELLPAP
ncbi:2253_t:CDS:2, partial [Scutellospora calospora]